jgi:hypothetical protein
MGYPEIYNALHRWRDELRQTHAGDALVHAIEQRIAREADPTASEILIGFLAQEHVALGNQAAADAALRRDPVYEIHHWYETWRPDASGADIVAALEERIRNETDPRKLSALRFNLISEHRARGDHAAAEAVARADIAANPDEPLPLISLANQKLCDEGKPQAALPIIDRAIEVAMRAGLFRRQALATKARIALALDDYRIVEDMMRQIMALTFTPGNQDIGVERDILDRLPPDGIDAEVARAYDAYCRAHGKLRTVDPHGIASHEGTTIVASRRLTMTVEGREIDVPVTIFAPSDRGDHWRCEFEIGWPGRTRRGKGYGIDSVQALLIAMQCIGIELYSSEAHEAGQLKWERSRGGYGFPLHSGIRDLYEGDDKRM